MAEPASGVALSAAETHDGRNEGPMTGRLPDGGPTRAIVIFAAAIPLAGQAIARPVCVVCDTPSAIYLCDVEKSDVVDKYPKTAGALQYACVTHVAKLGRHTQCKVSRFQGDQCLGRPVKLSLSQVLALTPPETANEPRQGQQDLGPAEQTGKTTAGSGEKGPPRTVEELAAQTVKKSKEGLSKAGDTVNKTAKTAGQAIGKAAEKTWDCLSSLFAKCW